MLRSLILCVIFITSPAFGQVIEWQEPMPPAGDIGSKWQRADIESDRALAQQVALLRDVGLSVDTSSVVAAIDNQTDMLDQLRLELAGLAASLVVIVAWLTRTKKTTGLAPGETVNINVADVARLDLLPGVGPSLAQAIIDHRETSPFETPAAITDVSGIGDSIYDGLKQLIVVE